MKTTTTLAAVANTTIDFLMAESILDKLGYSLQDLSLEYGDVVIPSGDISHVLFYSSHHSTFNSMGSIWVENDIYYVSGNANYATPEQAALELLDRKMVEDCAMAIKLERSMQKEYL